MVKNISEYIKESILADDDALIKRAKNDIDPHLKVNIKQGSTVTKQDAVDFTDFIISSLSLGDLLENYIFEWHIEKDYWECGVFFDNSKSKQKNHEFIFVLGYREGMFVTDTFGNWNRSSKKFKTYIEPIIKNLPKLHEDANIEVRTNKVIKKFKF